MNKKGFMMAELIVVSSIVLVTLVALYTSYNKIYSVYKTRLGYYDVTTLYRLGYYRDILVENNILPNVIEMSNSGIVEIYNSSSSTGKIFELPDTEKPTGVNDLVYLMNNDGNSIDRSLFDGKDMHVTFLEYVDYLEGSLDFSRFDYMMIMERCAIGDEDNCNYAYLEIFEDRLSNEDEP